MKKLIKLFSLVLAGSLLFFSCGEKEPEKKVVLESIEATLTETNYFVGDEVAADDVSVLASYDDGSTKAISVTEDMLSYDTSSAGEVDLTVTYEDKTSVVTINVYEGKLNGAVSVAEGSSPLYVYADGSKSAVSVSYEIVESDYTGEGDPILSKTYTLNSVDVDEETKKASVTVLGTPIELEIDVKVELAKPAVAGGEGTYTVYLGGENTALLVKSVEVNSVVTDFDADNGFIQIGKVNGTSAVLGWNDYANFLGYDVSKEAFSVTYNFKELVKGPLVWNEWAMSIKDNDDGSEWYLRSDDWSNSTMASYPNLNYDGSGLNVNGKDLSLTVTKVENSLVATLKEGDTVLRTVTASPATTTSSIALGYDSCAINVSKFTVDGTEFADKVGVYGGKDAGFNRRGLATADLSRDASHSIVYEFTIDSDYTNVWNAWVLDITHGDGSTCFYRADNYAMGALTGYSDYEADHWAGMTPALNFEDFKSNFGDVVDEVYVPATMKLTVDYVPNEGEAEGTYTIKLYKGEAADPIWSCVNSYIPAE